MPLSDDPVSRAYSAPLAVNYRGLSGPLDLAQEATLGRDRVTPVQDDSPIYTEGAAVSLVNGVGKLALAVQHSTATTPSAYPTALRVVTGDLTIYIDEDGVEVFDAVSDNYARIDPVGVITVHNDTNNKTITISPTSLANNITIDANGIKVINASSSDYAKIAETGVITVFDNSGSKTLTIDPSAVTRDMSIQTWDVCDSGTPKSALVLASAPF